MKSVKKSFSKMIRISNIRKEDFEYIESLLIKLNPTDLVIKLPGYELESVNELQSLNKKLTVSSVEYIMHKPEYVSVDIDKYGMRLYTADGDNIAIKGVFSDIEQRFNSRFLHFILVLGELFTCIGFSSLVVFPVIISINRLKGIDYYVDRVVAVMIIALSIAVIGVAIKWFNRFSLNIYEKVPNFFKRNADKLVITAISLVVGGVITYIVTLITK